jgi:Family of unknown function (DUF6188)/SecD/SecF GG Motif
VTVDPGLTGQTLTKPDVGFTVRLDFTGGYEVQVETRFTVRIFDGDRAIVPGADTEAATTALAALAGRVVTVATADDSGGLRIDLEGGARVLAEADPDYEAWTAAGPGGMKVVSLPGGGLSVWSSQG